MKKILGIEYKLKTRDGHIRFILERKEKNKYYGFCTWGLPEGATNNKFQITYHDLQCYLENGLCSIIH